MTKLKSVSVIGLGKLGSPIAASFASRGFTTIGLDVNPKFVEALAHGRAPVVETGLQELIDKHKASLTATTDWNTAIMGSDASFIIVPTPSEPQGGFSNKFVVAACESIGAVLKNKKEFHLVVIVSTMMPGSSKKEIIPALERTSGKKAGKDFGYCYGATLLALGSVVNDFLKPEVIMIGGVDARSSDALEAIYREVLVSTPVYHKVTPTEAELAKIGINTFITTKISFANMLGMIADSMEDVDVRNVTKIIGSDSRIGAKYFKSGGAYGGPCFPRDNRALAYSAKLAKVETFIPQATDATNKQYIAHLGAKVQTALAKMKPGASVGVVGIAYKPDTDVVEEATGLHLAHHLVGKGIPVIVYDPIAGGSAKKAFGDSVQHADSLKACLASSHVVVLTNPYKNLFAEIDPALIKGKTIIDCWGVLDKQGAVLA